jgi:thioredoxin reductase (NADPH)
LVKLLDMAKIDSRNEQMFPKLRPNEINRLHRFGDVRHYAPGEALFVTGSVAPGTRVLIKGWVRVTRDPLGHSAPIEEQGPGDFVADVGQLSGQPAFVDVHAIDDVGKGPCCSDADGFAVLEPDWESKVAITAYA